MTRNACGAACLALYTAVAIPGCSGGDDGPGPARDRIKAVVLPFLTMSAFHIAVEEGYFAEQDLDIELVRLARDVGAGQLAINVLNTIAGGERIRLVGDAGHLDPEGCTFNAAVVRRHLAEASELDTTEELRGRRFELDVALPQGYWASRMLVPFGLTLEDVGVENLPPPATIEALGRGSLDVAILSEPYLSQVLETGEVVIWRRTEEVVPGFQLSSVMFGPTLLDERPEVGQRFMVAFLKAVRQFNRGKSPRNLEILERGTGLSRAQLSAACWPSFRDDGRVNLAGMTEYQRWARSRALVDRVLEADELVDHRFIEHAHLALPSMAGK